MCNQLLLPHGRSFLKSHFEFRALFDFVRKSGRSTVIGSTTNTRKIKYILLVCVCEPPSFLLIGCTLRKSGSSQRNSGSIYNSIYYTHPSTIIAAPTSSVIDLVSLIINLCR
ncbi:hypothetical protein OUZ56_004447 [Daphnia magna]|uniref:Uncharacterized protein n=1 Tax=Daphnia magna TaxID=35525 RepID=A0ABQ9YQ68_9CRUS|nr:hypothetical protein OUZ56_004447 [Daphnia magna]